MTTAPPSRNQCIRAIVGAASTWFVTGIHAQAPTPRPDTSAWRCEQCPQHSDYKAHHSLGATHISDDSARFGNATGYDERGSYVFAESTGDLNERDYVMRWDFADLGVDARALTIEGGSPGVYEYRLGYSELPYRRFDDTQTVFRKADAQTLTLPSGWIGASTTAGMAALGTSLSSRDIESDRTSYEIGGAYRGLEALRFSANYRRAERRGWDILGASFYNNSVLLAAPFDDRTDLVDLSVSYHQERGFLQLAWFGSFYDNAQRSLRWDNPFFAGDGPTQGELSQSPNNEAQALTLSGAYHFPARTTLSLSASIGDLRQDASLLGYTIDPALAGALPRENFDGQVDTTHYDVRVTSQPWQFLRLRALYRYDERDNRSSISLWSRTITDLFPSNEPEVNRPYGFDRTRVSLSASTRFDGLKALRFEGGYDRVDMDRSLQEVAKQSEDTGWGRVAWRAPSGPEISLRAGTSKRDIDRYDAALAAAYEQNPLLRKYNLAYRFRDFVELRATANLGAMPLAFGAQAYYASDDYTESTLGLRKADDRRFAADLTWTISDHAIGYLQGAYEDMALRAVNSESFSGPDWNSQHSDRFLSFGTGVNLDRLLSDRFGVRVHLTYARGRGDVNVSSSNTAPAAFPGLDTKLKSVDLDLNYRFTNAMDLRLRLRYEDFASSDWALAGVEPATIPTVLTLGADPYDYEVLLATIAIQYWFGRTPQRTDSEESK